jgi:hypothetical protein
VSVDRSTPVVAVTSPNGAESWLQGSVHAITWTASDAEGIAANSITLQYSVDNGANWLPVASGLANSGSFDWTVPNNPSATALVRASALDVHANPGSDASDAVFTLQGTTTTSLASVPNPSLAGESVALTPRGRRQARPVQSSSSTDYLARHRLLSGGTASLNIRAAGRRPFAHRGIRREPTPRRKHVRHAQPHGEPAATTTSLASPESVARGPECRAHGQRHGHSPGPEALA